MNCLHTWWVNTMLILQKPPAHGTTQRLFCRIRLNTNQEEEWESNQPTYANFPPNFERSSSSGCQVWLWGPQPPGTTKDMPRTEEHVHKGSE